MSDSTLAIVIGTGGFIGGSIASSLIYIGFVLNSIRNELKRTNDTKPLN